jgi:hypothetical protein
MVTRALGKKLVIDASIARAAGGKSAIQAQSKDCRDCLQAMLEHRHKMVMSAELKAEWDKHQSRFAKTWRSQMLARRRFVALQTPLNASLIKTISDCIDEVTETIPQREAGMKDIHLLEAALLSDQRVLSLDDNTARKIFARVAQKLPDMTQLIWVNPVNPDEQAMRWLELGALEDPSRYLKQWLKD